MHPFDSSATKCPCQRGRIAARDAAKRPRGRRCRGGASCQHTAPPPPCPRQRSAASAAYGADPITQRHVRLEHVRGRDALSTDGAEARTRPVCRREPSELLDGDSPPRAQTPGAPLDLGRRLGARSSSSAELVGEVFGCSRRAPGDPQAAIKSAAALLKDQGPSLRQKHFTRRRFFSEGDARRRAFGR